MQHIYVLSVTALCLATPVASLASPSIPEEPGEELLVEQSFDTVVGLLFRNYSLRGDGHVDYRTARHILGVSYDDPASEGLEVAPYPLLYWYDASRDGNWQVWVDRNEDGTIADATRYDGAPDTDLLTSSTTWQ